MGGIKSALNGEINLLAYKFTQSAGFCQHSSLSFCATTVLLFAGTYIFDILHSPHLFLLTEVSNI